jgi:hypothetical protein
VLTAAVLPAQLPGSTMSPQRNPLISALRGARVVFPPARCVGPRHVLPECVAARQAGGAPTLPGDDLQGKRDVPG